MDGGDDVETVATIGAATRKQGKRRRQQDVGEDDYEVIKEEATGEWQRQ